MTSITYWLFDKEQKTIRAALYVLVGPGKTDDHYKLKTSERGTNPKHCREVVTLAVKLGEDGMKGVRGKYGKTTKQLLHAATGRPSKSANASDKHLAEEMTVNILRDLRRAAGRVIGQSNYKAGRIKSPDNSDTIKTMIVQADKFAAEFEAEIKADAKPKKAPRTHKRRATKKVA